MKNKDELRLLPWSGPEGKPCYLSADDSDGHMSRLADNIEAVQLGMAANLLEQALEVLGDGDAALEQLRPLATQLAGALRDTIRVATSRGHRLVTPESHQS
ncbi:hypothetical protein ACFOZ0_06510 [Streptomyces yaanensis]|uniref:Uncharacterized protein n=1 Tax=Streptomyces yaanensis TaxID=1142239 RepID=A0ABV7S7E9_9ACTN|nr:hypothetical protein [Streptomyces sp. CGMCC 4.7035]WNC02452.1 hypothetical protein Q2K21_32770 [Streptomyces sp. CGMCC 4.7035]